MIPLKFRARINEKGRAEHLAEWQHFTLDDLLDGHARELDERIDRKTIGQFTGLHDRHGKEIWEGDKVRFLRKQGYWSHDKGDVEVVKYITDPQAQYCGFGFSALHPLTSRKAKKIEVVGNIFEGGE